MPPRKPRARLQRAMSTGPSETADAMEQLRNATPELMEKWIARAGDNPQMAAALIRLMENDILRAQQGQADSLLQRIQQLRQVGSPMLTTIWNQAARAAVQQGMEIGFAQVGEPVLPLAARVVMQPEPEPEDPSSYEGRLKAWRENVGPTGLPRGLPPEPD